MCHQQSHLNNDIDFGKQTTENVTHCPLKGVSNVLKENCGSLEGATLQWEAFLKDDYGEKASDWEEATAWIVICSFEKTKKKKEKKTNTKAEIAGFLKGLVEGFFSFLQKDKPSKRSAVWQHVRNTRVSQSARGHICPAGWQQSRVTRCIMSHELNPPGGQFGVTEKQKPALTDAKS